MNSAKNYGNNSIVSISTISYTIITKNPAMKTITPSFLFGDTQIKTDF